MLTKIHIDNFRCFSDFSLDLRSINLFVGINGSGKTTVFDVLRKLQNFVVNGEKASDVFSITDNPRWTTIQNGRLESKDQIFGLEFEEEGHSYKYTLSIRFGLNGARVELEHLVLDDDLLMTFEDESLLLAQSIAAAEVPLSANRSAIGMLPETPALEKISSFRHIMQRIMVIQVTPSKMEIYSSGTNSQLSYDTSNLVSWYRFLMEDQDRLKEISNSLKEIFSDFSHFELQTIPTESSADGLKNLLIHFEDQNQSKRKTVYSLSELSDGQRAIIALYAIMIYAKREHILLCLDEPENFLALTEIQPWLIELYDLCGPRSLQAILISHHPEMINYLGNEVGIWFERPNNGPVVVHRMQDIHRDVQLPMAELVARGWLDV